MRMLVRVRTLRGQPDAPQGRAHARAPCRSRCARPKHRRPWRLAAQSSASPLRPHAKSHKCIEIAQRLARAGAIGVSCATIGEAEAMALGGLRGILVTAPLDLARCARSPSSPACRASRHPRRRRRSPPDRPRLAEVAGRAAEPLPVDRRRARCRGRAAPDASRSPMSSRWLARSRGSRRALRRPPGLLGQSAADHALFASARRASGPRRSASSGGTRGLARWPAWRRRS